MKRLHMLLVLVAVLFASTAGTVLAAQTYEEFGVPVDTGASFNSENGQLSWSAGSGSFTSNVRARYTPKSASNVLAAPDGSIWVGQPFSLKLTDYDTGAEISLNKSATMTIHYNPADLGGRSETGLRIARRFDTWTDLTSTVDTVNHTVVAQTPWGGDYGLFVSNVAPPARPAASPAATPAPTAVPTAAPALAASPATPAEPATNPARPAAGGSDISGRVYYDQNGNGVFDAGDYPVAGAGVFIMVGDSYAFTRSAADGYYSFRGLAAGSYAVNLIVGPEWSFTTPDAIAGMNLSGELGSVGIADFGMWRKVQ